MVQRMTTQNFNSSGQTEILLLSIEKQVPNFANKVSHSVYAHKQYKTQSTSQKWKIYAMLFTLFQLFTI